jgi:hypothetical protein
MSKNNAEETVYVVYFVSSFLGNINGIQLAKFGLSIDRA